MTVQCTQAFNPAARLRLGASAWHEAANLCVAVAVVIGPHNGRAETVGLGYNGVVRHHNPFPLNSYAIVPILRVPIDILHADTVGKSAAQSVSAGEAVEPLLKRRIGESSVVPRV